MKMTLKEITLAALLAAVYTVTSFLPGFPVIGVSGSRIDFSRSLEISYGLILGPALGPFTAFLGDFIGTALTGSSLFFTPLSIVSAFMAAALNRERLLRLRGWLLSAIPLAGLIVCWYPNPCWNGGILLSYTTSDRSRHYPSVQRQDHRVFA